MKRKFGRFLLTAALFVLTLFLVSACGSSGGGSSSGSSSSSTNSAPSGGSTPGDGGSSLTPSALAGNWNFNQILTNSPGWQRTELTNGPLAINASGVVTGTGVTNGGSSTSFNTTLTVANGIINSASDLTLGGATDSGNTVAAFTDTNNPNVNLTVLTRSLDTAGGYSLSDLNGTWMFHAFDSDNPNWIRGQMTISDGSFTFNMTQQSGKTGTPAGTMTIDGTTGIINVTITSGGGNNPPTAFQCALDSGKTVAVCTLNSGNDTSMGVLVKSYNNLALSDMAGTWQMEQIKYRGPKWERGSITFTSGGTISSIDTLESNGSTNTTPPSGTATLSSDPGSITAPWDDDLECSLDYSGLIAVCTAGNTSDGNEAINILLKQ